MNDDNFFRELQEDIQRQRFFDIWNKYGKTLIGVAVAVVLGTSAGVGWKYYKAHQNAAYSAALIHAEGDEKELSAFMEAAQGHAHASLAGLQLAAKQLEEGNAKDALAGYTRIATDEKNEMVRSVAAVMALSVAVGNDLPLPEVAQPKAGSPFALEWAELSAWRAYGDGTPAEAAEAFAEIVDKPAASPALRERASMMAASLAPDAPAEKAKE